MHNKVNILIVEDEFITLDNLQDLAEDLGYAVSGTAMKAEQAIEILDRGNTDIAILDIHLKGEKSGIWVAQRIQKTYKIPFIFLSAYSDKKTVEAAAETNPSAYLVKPFSKPSVYTAIEVALKNFAQKSNENTDNLILNQSVFIKEDRIYKKLHLADIQYIEAFKNYLELQLNEGRHIIRSTLKDFLNELPETYFLQTHRSFVVNKNFVEKVGSSFVEIKSKQIPLTKRFRETFLKNLKL